VPLVELIQEYNPTLQRKGPAKYATGHEPAHTSSSGTCLVIWADAGRWKCMSCGKGGDAVTWVMAIQGVSALAAMRYLAERFGAPQGWHPPRRQRTAPPAAPPAITVGGGRRALVMREGGQ
jgi:DNA primase